MPDEVTPTEGLESQEPDVEILDPMEPVVLDGGEIKPEPAPKGEPKAEKAPAEAKKVSVRFKDHEKTYNSVDDALESLVKATDKIGDLQSEISDVRRQLADATAKQQQREAAPNRAAEVQRLARAYQEGYGWDEETAERTAERELDKQLDAAKKFEEGNQRVANLEARLQNYEMELAVQKQIAALKDPDFDLESKEVQDIFQEIVNDGGRPTVKMLHRIWKAERFQREESGTTGDDLKSRMAATAAGAEGGRSKPRLTQKQREYISETYPEKGPQRDEAIKMFEDMNRGGKK